MAVPNFPAVGTMLFMLYAACIGALLSGVFRIYPMPTLAMAFCITGGMFAVMSIYGYITKRDLSSVHSMFMMAGFGLIVASLGNMFLASSVLDWIITYGILIVFVVLIATKTQQLRLIAIQYADNANLASRYAIVGSIFLYITFINIFMSVLRILGGRR